MYINDSYTIYNSKSESYAINLNFSRQCSKILLLTAEMSRTRATCRGTHLQHQLSTTPPLKQNENNAMHIIMHAMLIRLLQLAYNTKS